MATTKIAPGKVNVGDRILVADVAAVLVEMDPDWYAGKVAPSDKVTTGRVAMVRKVGHYLAPAGTYRKRSVRHYEIETSEGMLIVSAVKKITLAGGSKTEIKKAHEAALIEDAERKVEDAWAKDVEAAHVEALAESVIRAPKGAAIEAEEFTVEERAALVEDLRTSGALDDAHAEALVEDEYRDDVRSDAQMDAFLTKHQDATLVEAIEADHAKALEEDARRGRPRWARSPGKFALLAETRGLISRERS